MYDEASLRWFDKNGKARPTHLPHGITDTPDNPLSAQLPRLKCRNWRLEGNSLICDTDYGPLVQTIDPGHICHGTDAAGLPILKKIVL